MDRRTYLIASTATVTTLAGCGALGGIDAEPETDEFGLMQDRGAYEDLSQGIDEVEAGSSAIFGAQYRVPVDEGEVDYEATVTVRRDGTTIDTERIVASEPVDVEGDRDEREAWFEFETETWSPTTHEAEFAVVDGHTDEETEPATVSFDLVLPTLAVDGLSPSSPAGQQGSQVAIAATVENDGEVSVTEDVGIEVGGESFGTESIGVDAGDAETVEFEVDTADLAVGEHDLRVRGAADEHADTLTVHEPLPDPTVEAVRVPDPVQLDIHQAGRDFSVEVRNDGDTGDVGYALTFSDSLFFDPWDEEVEASDTDEVEAGAEAELGVYFGGTFGDDNIYNFRLWPASVRADVVNEGFADGRVAVTLLDDGESIETRTVELAVDEPTTVEFSIDAPEEEPGEFTVETDPQDG